MSGQNRQGRTMPKEILDSIEQFRAARLGLLPFLDRTWAQIHDLAPQAKVDIGELEDLWTEIEIIYALAAEAKQTQLDDAQAHEVQDAVARLALALAGPP